MDSVIRRSSYLELILFRFYRWQVHVGMPPFSTHRFVHTTMIILDFTREWVSSRERDDSCVFCNFLCFGGCLVNCFSSNTSCTCLDSVIGRSSYSVFFYVYPLFFHIFFLWLGTFFLYFSPFDGFSNPEIQLFRTCLYIGCVQYSLKGRNCCK